MTLFILCVTLLLVSLDLTDSHVALPSIVRGLHATSSQLQWIVDAYAVAFAGLLLTLGALGDRVGAEMGVPRRAARLCRGVGLLSLLRQCRGG